MRAGSADHAMNQNQIRSTDHPGLSILCMALSPPPCAGDFSLSNRASGLDSCHVRGCQSAGVVESPSRLSVPPGPGSAEQCGRHQVVCTDFKKCIATPLNLTQTRQRRTTAGGPVAPPMAEPAAPAKRARRAAPASRPGRILTTWPRCVIIWIRDTSQIPLHQLITCTMARCTIRYAVQL